MRQIFLAAAVLSLTACTKTVKVETTETIVGRDTSRTTVITEDYDISIRDAAKARYDSARVELKRAKERGDKVAEAAAQRAVDETKAAWEKTKEELREGAAKAGAALKKAGEKLDSTFVKRDTIVVKKIERK